MIQIDKKITVTAAILAAVAIAFGAFGAHGLKNLVSMASVQSFETGVRYQMYHALALLILGFLPGISKSTKRWVFGFFLVGIVLFSGSIYLLALQSILGFNVKFLGPVTPLGGVLLIFGWLRLAYGLLTIKGG